MHILQSTTATSVYATEMIYALSQKRKNDQQFQLQTRVQFCFILARICGSNLSRASAFRYTYTYVLFIDLCLTSFCSTSRRWIY